MRIKKEKETAYRLTVIDNQGTFGKLMIQFVEKWADLMEDELLKGNQIKDVAEKTSIEAGRDKISNFLYLCASNILENAWEYGDQLKTAHDEERSRL